MFILFAFDTAGAYLASLYTEHCLHPPATEKQSESYQFYPKTKKERINQSQRDRGVRGALCSTGLHTLKREVSHLSP